jgi:hypothetical protein
MTEFIATTTEIKQSMKTVALNLKGFFGVSSGPGPFCGFSGLSPCMMDGMLGLEFAPSSFSCIVIDVDDNSDRVVPITVFGFIMCFSLVASFEDQNSRHSFGHGKANILEFRFGPPA